MGWVAEVDTETGIYEMTWLSLDPSSTRTGYAIWRDVPTADNLVESGTLRPLPADDTPLARIQTMDDELDQLLLQHKPGNAVVEIPNLHTHRRVARAHGLATYGTACGWLGRTVRCHVGHVLWQDNTWTAGSTKTQRVIEIEARFPHYDRRADSGQDECDALALGLWAGRQVRTRALLAQTE